MRQIPLRANDGSVRAYAIVDDADYEWLNAWRWFRTDNRVPYASRKARKGEPQGNIRMHRQILGLAIGDPRDTDHINGDGLDNRRENLRVVTRAQNNQNRRVMGRSGHRNVYWRPRDRYWVVQLTIGGRQIYDGGFENLEDAVARAVELRREHAPFAVEDRTSLSERGRKAA